MNVSFTQWCTIVFITCFTIVVGISNRVIINKELLKLCLELLKRANMPLADNLMLKGNAKIIH